MHRIVDEQIDLEQSIIDGVAMELPMSPLCSEDCPGLCPRCGVRLAIADPDHSHDVIDPRWAGLAAKLDTLKEDGKTDDNDGTGGGTR